MISPGTDILEGIFDSLRTYQHIEMVILADIEDIVTCIGPCISITLTISTAQGIDISCKSLAGKYLVEIL